MDWLDGSEKAPAVRDPSYEAWQIDNSMILVWVN